MRELRLTGCEEVVQLSWSVASCAHSLYGGVEWSGSHDCALASHDAGLVALLAHSVHGCTVQCGYSLRLLWKLLNGPLGNYV